MITKETIGSVLGHTAYDSSHKKIGRIGQVYLDERTGQPEWMTVRTGMFGTRESFVPLAPAEVRDDEVIVPYPKDHVTEAPNVDVDANGYLSEQEEAQLYGYYGVAQPTAPAAPPAPAPPKGRGTAAEETVTRSEERLRVGTETREAGRAHLRKYVVTEEQQQTVPVRKEKVHMEREPITDQNRGREMPDISEADREVVLQEERPLVAKETVPVERVKVTKEQTGGQETVGGQVRKERIEAEGFQEEGR
jgi:uncharacterized protein (TIGR02271 family)